MFRRRIALVVIIGLLAGVQLPAAYIDSGPGEQAPSRQAPKPLTGPYLGQPPPGSTPQVFAPGIVSTEADELNAVFTPDGKEFYFTIHGTDGRMTIMRMAIENGQWSTPRPASFSGRWIDADPFITSDGRRLYFCSNRPVQGEAGKDFDIWFCERSGAGWGEPQNLGEPINSPSMELYPSVTNDGTMYFQSSRPGGPGGSDWWRARLRDGRYVDAECLPAPINTPGEAGDGLIAPDESYLILSTLPEGTGRAPGSWPTVARDDFTAATSAQAGGPPPPPPPPPARATGAQAGPPPPPPSAAVTRLFLSLRRPDGTWSPLVSLEGGINSPDAGVNCQMLSSDGRYLFFTRGFTARRGDIYWVDASVIEDAKRRAANGR
jgi:hypothetical protein